MQGGRTEPNSGLSGVDAILEALATRAGLDLPFAPPLALTIPAADNAAAPFDDADAWLTTGADVAMRLLDAVIEPDEPLTIIGGDAEGVAELQRRYGLTDVRWRCAPTRLRHNPDAILAAAEFAAAQGSRFVFICVDAPMQEVLAYAVAQRGRGRGVGLCVGVPLDDLCGPGDRVPHWMRDLGLAWLHRLLRDPHS